MKKRFLKPSHGVFAQFAMFFLNGGIMGILAWAIQLSAYKILGGNSSQEYVIAGAIAYTTVVIINFQIQRKFIFRKGGIFFRFLIADLAIMLLVLFLSLVCRELIALSVGQDWGDRGGFLCASLLGSVPSFLLRRYWVFKLLPQKT